MGAQASFADGMRAAKEVQKDLQWTQKRVEYVRSCCPPTSFLELIDFPVHSMTELRANTPNSSELLSDDTRHQSTTRSFDHKTRHTTLLMIPHIHISVFCQNPAALLHSLILPFFLTTIPSLRTQRVSQPRHWSVLRLSSTSLRSTPLHPLPAASLL
jgi:hypothetical protein